MSPKDVCEYGFAIGGSRESAHLPVGKFTPVKLAAPRPSSSDVRSLDATRTCLSGNDSQAHCILQ